MKSYDSFNSSSNGEGSETPVKKFEQFSKKVKSWKKKIAEHLGLSGKELTEATDEALVASVQETIAAADEDGVRTEQEVADIQEAVETVVMQGAMEEAGFEESSGGNPILELDQADTSGDLVAAIDDLHSEGVTLPDGREVAELAVDAIERAKWDHMIPLEGGPHGSNEGGWYQDPETGDKYYVKFYRNPDQGRVEFVANAIYEKLGIKTVRSELVEIGGREAVASKQVPGARRSSRESQHDSQEVRDGFVADAFLANWDVVGLEYDNIVESDDGFYRIDNGGAMTFHAKGDPKEFVHDDIPELHSMLEHGQAKHVFNGITESEIRTQAKRLLDRLSPEDIEEIVARSGLEGEQRDKVLKGLLGRREFLVRLCAEGGDGAPDDPGNPDSDESGSDYGEAGEQPPRKGLGEVIADIRSREMERSGETEMRPRAELICDSSHIENQRIDIVSKPDSGMVELTFKMRDRSVAEAMTSGKTASGAQVESGAIVFDGKSKYGSTKSFTACKAMMFERDGVRVLVAPPGTDIRAMLGVVKMEIPGNMPPDEAEKVVARIMEEEFHVPDGIGEVSEADERAYKQSLYRWHHKIEGDLSPEEAEAAERLERREVFPGYTAMVEPGKHLEYAAKYGGDLRAIHSLYTGDAKSIHRVLTSGLMASSERYSRGVMRSGMSTSSDFETGGADSVFTRIQGEEKREGGHGSVIVFKPELFDRTDWYVYKSDEYGQTGDDVFRYRETPDSMMQAVADHPDWHGTNEQMFRTGIGPQYIEKILVSLEDRDEIIAKLKAMGIEEFDGRPIEEVIVLRQHDAEREAEFKLTEAEKAQKAAEEAAKKAAEAAAKRQALLEKKQAIMEGGTDYTFDDLTTLMGNGDDANEQFKMICDSAIAHGGKEKLTSEVTKALLESDLGFFRKYITEGVAYDEEETELMDYLVSALGLDMQAIYEQAVAAQEAKKAKPDDTDDFATPKLWPDDMATPELTPHPFSSDPDGFATPGLHGDWDWPDFWPDSPEPEPEPEPDPEPNESDGSESGQDSGDDDWW